MKRIIPLLLVLPALAGCVVDDPVQENDFDGDAALQWVEKIVYVDDDALRPRAPSSEGRDATIDWLEESLSVTGWNVVQDTFSGADYNELDKGSVERYTSGPYCQQEDRDQLPDLSFTNLYATLPGDGDGQVVLAAHWDAKEDAPGGKGPIPAANDGASGMGVLLQLQRHLATEGASLPFDLTIAFFDGEDGFEDCHPLAGSLWAARQGSLGHVSQLILLDMVGDADARFIKESQSVNSDGALVDAVWDIAGDRGLESNFVDCAGSRCAITDDHVPFIEEGVEAIDIIDGGRSRTFPPYWHTMEDTPDKLSPVMLGAVGGVLVTTLTDPDVQDLLQD